MTRFRLSERIPLHNLYRWLAEWVDWTFLYEETRALYSHTSQPSLDPVVFFKLVLVGRLENLVSDHRLIEHCALRLDRLLLLGYEVDEELPWHSTGSRTANSSPPRSSSACSTTSLPSAWPGAWSPAIRKPWIRPPSRPTPRWRRCSKSKRRGPAARF